jgi:hypothetical protein
VGLIKHGREPSVLGRRERGRRRPIGPSDHPEGLGGGQGVDREIAVALNERLLVEDPVLRIDVTPVAGGVPGEVGLDGYLSTLTGIRGARSRVQAAQSEEGRAAFRLGSDWRMWRLAQTSSLPLLVSWS